MPTPDDDSTSAIGRIREGRAVRVGAVADTLRRMRESVSILDPAADTRRCPNAVRCSWSPATNWRCPSACASRRLPRPISRSTTSASSRSPPGYPSGTDAGAVEAIVVDGDVHARLCVGVRLGAGPIRLSVNSNAYGKPLFVVTIVAAAILVLSSRRRLWHRFRGTPDPADADRPRRARKTGSSPAAGTPGRRGVRTWLTDHPKTRAFTPRRPAVSAHSGPLADPSGPGPVPPPPPRRGAPCAMPQPVPPARRGPAATTAPAIRHLRSSSALRHRGSIGCLGGANRRIHRAGHTDQPHHRLRAHGAARRDPRRCRLVGIPSGLRAAQHDRRGRPRCRAHRHRYPCPRARRGRRPRPG